MRPGSSNVAEVPVRDGVITATVTTAWASARSRNWAACDWRVVIPATTTQTASSANTAAINCSLRCDTAGRAGSGDMALSKDC